ncbi:MAG: cation diffusion facilitator family transporter [Salibacteraceae bacterium]|nr:cation diffusion facilitator family transporter [Salibacteraceae bacterium]|tara:strand:+ start:58677 stop:59591 length:915 start_codon:yes stop_codon:yes gene_type:complete
MNRQQRIIRASWIGIGINSILAISKIGGGYLFDSLAVIGDGIDSANDVGTYFITLIAARIIVRPPDPKFPYGYNRAEAVATKLLSFFIFFIGAQLVFSSIIDLWNGTSRHVPAFGAIVVTVISVLVKLILSYWQMKEGRSTSSKMLIANAHNMRSDIILSLGVLIGVSCSFFFQQDWLDHFIGLLVGVWILKVAFELFRETSFELMDSVEDIAIYTKIFEAVNSIKEANNPHRLRVRRLSNLLMIDLDIELEESLTMKDAHLIGIDVENAIKDNVENVYDIMIHFEPLGNIEEDETYGVHQRDM